jgi:hypothetical protein
MKGKKMSKISPNIIDSILSIFFFPRIDRHKTKTCRLCNREYKHFDQAKTCEDWDMVLGVNRKRG